GERIGQGRESAKDFLRAHPETARQGSARIIEKAGLKLAGGEPPAVERKEKGKGR
ncbi:MAG: DNA recombination/repair protein RecA, partial [Deltaproteobacteria bacterium]|nr:DNA recombination/repair protein RecA [Deltaproteobacteria bacterium]